MLTSQLLANIRKGNHPVGKLAGDVLRVYDRSGKPKLSAPSERDTPCICLETDGGSVVLIDGTHLFQQKRELSDSELDFIWDTSRAFLPPNHSHEEWTRASWAMLP